MAFVAVPKEMAAQVGQDCRKDQVVILSFDQSCGLLHVTAWGSDVDQQQAAESLSRNLAAVCGGDLRGETIHGIPTLPGGLDGGTFGFRTLEKLYSQLVEARELIAYMRDRFAGHIAPLDAHAKWSHQFPASADSWLERARAWQTAVDAPAKDAGQ